jgi:hypothetical protein
MNLTLGAAEPAGMTGGEIGQYYAGLRVWERPDTSLGPVIEKLAAIEKMSELRACFIADLNREEFLP